MFVDTSGRSDSRQRCVHGMDGSTSAKTMSAGLFAVVNIDMLFSENLGAARL